MGCRVAAVVFGVVQKIIQKVEDMKSFSFGRRFVTDNDLA